MVVRSIRKLKVEERVELYPLMISFIRFMASLDSERPIHMKLQPVLY